MRIELHWRRPLFYLLLPILIVLAFVGFPIPVAPPPALKPTQEQSQKAEDDRDGKD